MAAKKSKRGTSAPRPAQPKSDRSERITLFLSAPQRTVLAKANARALVRERPPTTLLKLALTGLRVEHPDLYAELEELTKGPKAP